MQKVLKIVLLVIAAIVLLALGVAAGTSLQTQKAAPELEKASQLIAKLNSKLVPSIIAAGTVKEISGNTITLSAGSETLALPIKEGAQIRQVALPKPGETAGTPAEVSLADIKAGDYASVMVKVSADGSLEGASVSVFPIAR